MGINKVMGMCRSSSCHNMMSLLVTTAITGNTITTINVILLGLLMLHLMMPWDIAHLIALATLFDLI
jgi:hypothetical protein